MRKYPLKQHPADILKWVEKVMDSCETPNQYRSCNRMINNIQKIFNKSTVSEEYNWKLIRLELTSSFNELWMTTKLEKNK